jgi:hypothetical protein
MGAKTVGPVWASTGELRVSKFISRPHAAHIQPLLLAPLRPHIPVIHNSDSDCDSDSALSPLYQPVSVVSSWPFHVASRKGLRNPVAKLA